MARLMHLLFGVCKEITKQCFAFETPAKMQLCKDIVCDNGEESEKKSNQRELELHEMALNVIVCNGCS